MGNKKLSDEIRDAVNASGMSRYAIAKALGVAESTMSRFMNGKGVLSMEFIDRIEAGFVQVNQFSVAEASIEYGGTKISGIGRELSPESMIDHFTWSKTVIINYGTPGV